MIKTCMFAAAALLSANAIAAQSTLDVVMATPMTKSDMASVEGKGLTLRTATCSTCSLSGSAAVGTNGGHDGVGRAVSAVAKAASSKASR